MNKLDQIDADLLNLIQEGLPLTTQPFLTLAEQLCLTEEDVIGRLSRLKEEGLIRRLGAVFDSRAMGYYSTLCACAVPDDRLEEAAAAINQYSGVTHNYQRDFDLNLWFTLTVRDEAEAEQVLSQLEDSLGLKIVSMPSKKVYKIKVSFEMGGTDVL